MDQSLTDSQGAPVSVELDEPGQAYVIKDAAGTEAGRAHYLPGPNDSERIFYHTVVDSAFGGRGFSKVLVAQALADSRESGITVIPVCPLFVKKLNETGDDYRAHGGRFREPTREDMAIVRKSA